jgi:hypothetical protein
LSNPYPFDSSDPNAVRFQTRHGIWYLVYFLPSNDFFADYPEFSAETMTFGIAIEENPLGHLPMDSCIGDTVSIVIQKYFEQNPKGILLYTIENRDKRQAARKRLFDSWHEKQKSSRIEKQSGSIGKAPNETFFGLLFNAKHPHRGLIIGAVESFLLEIGAKE